MSLKVWRMLQKPLCGNQMNLATLKVSTVHPSNDRKIDTSHDLSHTLLLKQFSILLNWLNNLPPSQSPNWDACSSLEHWSLYILSTLVSVSCKLGTIKQIALIVFYNIVFSINKKAKLFCKPIGRTTLQTTLPEVSAQI